MKNSGTNEAEIIKLIKKKGVIRPKDLMDLQAPRQTLMRMVQAGTVLRLSRGIYALPDQVGNAHQTILEACKRVPHGIICLLSALRFHELTSQNPYEVWMAISHKSWRPKDEGLKFRIVHLSGKSLTSGIEDHNIEGTSIRVYSPAKTVADCFKFRNKVGLEVAIEALRDYIRRYPGGADELWRFAEICRVSKVIHPYLEAVM